MEEITLLIRGEIFKIKKKLLIKYSDYFQAMFSGKFIEDQQEEISIDIIDPSIMSIVVQYINNGSIDLLEHSLSIIDVIAFTADFLQINDLRQHIELTLEGMDICESNWMEVMAIAENYSYLKVEQLSAAVGLYSFKSMKPEYVSTIDKLAWYLSHPYLDAQSEFDVFDFGHQWVSNNEAGDDALLVILACLDFKRLTHQDIQGIKNNIGPFENSLASKVVNCLYELTSNALELSEIYVNEQKIKLCEKFTEKVWTEAIDIIKESKIRLLTYTPVVLIEDNMGSCPFPYNLTTFNQDSGFEKWLPDLENTTRWCLTSWGLTKLVILYENKNDAGIRMRMVKVYDTLRKEWTIHNIDIPPLSFYWGLAVLNNSLYIVGGVGDNHESLTTVTLYNLKQKTYRELAELPEEQVPAVCLHKNMVYVALRENIYCYEDSGALGSWRSVAGTNDIIVLLMTSYKDHIYCTEIEATNLYRFRPGVDKKLELFTSFSGIPFALTCDGNRLVAITYQTITIETLSVEEYQDENKEKTPKIIYRDTNNSLILEAMSGSCVLATTLPPLCKKVSEYHTNYLTTCTEPI